MENTLEARVDALEKDMAEVKGQLAGLTGPPEGKPPSVDSMIDALIYDAVSDAYGKATPDDHSAGNRTIPDIHTHETEV